MGRLRVVSAAFVVALVSVVACDDGRDAVAHRFCRVATSDRLRGLRHLDFADAGDVAAARSQLALLRSAAPPEVRHDLTRLLDGIDDLRPETAVTAPGAGDELAAAAHDVDRYLHDACGIDR